MAGSLRFDRKSMAGFSLVECLAALGILSLVVPSALGFLAAFRQQNAAEEAAQEMEANRKIVLDRVTLLVEQAGNNPLGIGLTPIQLNGSTGITVESDTNDGADGPPDGKLDGAFEQVTVEWDPTTRQVYQRSGKGTRQPLATEVSLFRVQGWDAAAQPAAVMENVAWVSVYVRAEKLSPLFGGGRTVGAEGSRRIPVLSRLLGK